MKNISLVQITQASNHPDGDEKNKPEPWRAAFAHRFHDLAALLNFVGVSPESVALPEGQDLTQFPLRVPIVYAEKIVRGDPFDPLLLQVLPSAREFDEQPGFVTDPLEESRFNPVQGVIHKYASRVLLVTTSACAVHCRYCFRRHFPYGDNIISTARFQAALEYIGANTALNEVILSGGDPLSIGDEKLFAMLNALATIPHIRRLRIHTRLLATIPSRVTDAFLEGIEGLEVPLTLVVHTNHAQELDDQLGVAARLLRQRGVHLLNQSVLLAGVNDCAKVLNQLHERLFELGILPYYLHLLDPVVGAQHFNVTEEQAKSILHSLLAIAPGYLVPKLVYESPGLLSKRMVDLH